MYDINLINKVIALKKSRNAVIFAHNYQRPEVFDTADYIGDSFYLAQIGQKIKADKIVFCGVTFMAEMVKVLNPDTKVYAPSMQALCPMAAMITKSKLIELQQKHPNAMTLCYVNTSAEVKTLCDVCCTSTNAVKIAQKLPCDEIIMVPDENLAQYVQEHTEKKIIYPPGWCYVHSKITEDKVIEAKRNYPDAPLIVHPECRSEVRKHGDAVLSTSGMVRYCQKSDHDTFIIATELGMIEVLRREVPGKSFLGVAGECIQQKKVTLENLYECLHDGVNEIILSPELIKKAQAPLQRMLEYGRDD